MKTSATAGFTLLELLISLTIFGMVSLIVYATMSLGAGAVERGETHSIENQRARAAVSLISRQLKSVYPLRLQTQGETFVYFFGSEQELRFIATTAQPETGGLETITYWLKKADNGTRSLWVRTSTPTLPSDLAEGREGGLRLETEVFSDLDALAWSYYGLIGTETEWVGEWDGKEYQKPPQAVRLSWQSRGGELAGDWTLEVPINVQAVPDSLRTDVQGGTGSRRESRIDRMRTTMGGGSPG